MSVKWPISRNWTTATSLATRVKATIPLAALFANIELATEDPMAGSDKSAKDEIIQ